MSRSNSEGFRANVSKDPASRDLQQGFGGILREGDMQQTSSSKLMRRYFTNFGFLVKGLLSYVAYISVAPPWLSAWIHKKRGVRIDNYKTVYIAANVLIDSSFPEHVSIGDHVYITRGAKVVCHTAFTPLTQQIVGCEYRIEDVVIKEGAYIGVNAVILPGVSGGEVRRNRRRRRGQQRCAGLCHRRRGSGPGHRRCSYALRANRAGSAMKVLLIIPAFNEEASLPKLLEEARAAGFDAIVVNDASRDGTEAAVKTARIPVLSLPVNLGIGGAVQTGFLYAARNGYDIAVQVDGDGQHNPALVKELIAPILEGRADCVIGSRYHPDSPDLDYVTPFARRIGMRFSTNVLRLATGLTIRDTTSGFRALSRAAFTFFAAEYPVDHPEAEALLLLHQRGFRILEIPTRMRGRVVGQSIFTFTRAALYPLRVLVGFAGLVLKTPRRLS